MNLEITFLDSLQNELSPTSVVIDQVDIESSAIGLDRFTDRDNPATGTFPIELSQDQLDQLYKTRFLKVSAQLQTSNNEEIKIRTTDYITLSVRAELTIESEVKHDF